MEVLGKRSSRHPTFDVLDPPIIVNGLCHTEIPESLTNEANRGNESTVARQN
jgi:hypothetical protein